MKVLTALFALVALLSLIVLATADSTSAKILRHLSQDNFVRNVTGGAIQGMESPNYPGVGVWKNIPFANAPRFQPPTPPTPWSGVRNTTEYGPGCLNHCLFPRPELTCSKTTAEDCLNLNIFSPDPAGSQGGLPVQFFIPGGAYQFGAGSVTLYSSEFNAQNENIVVVTINYRLGAFGALRTSNGLKGSYNLQDQIAALKWVRANIAIFGGDPNQITISGESAGAMSVGSLLASPAAQRLFHAAMMSSNPLGIPFQDVKTAEKLGHNFLKKAGCDDLSSAQAELQCLQSKDANFLLNISDDDKVFPWPSQIAVDVTPWTPTVDPSSDILPVQPFEAASLGKILTPVPVLLGNNANDSLLFIAEISAKPMSAFEANAVLVAFFGIKNTIKINEIYPNPTNPDNRIFLSQVFTDYLFTCANRNYAANLQKQQQIDSYIYLFNHLPSFAKWLWEGSDDVICGQGGGYICHASDLPFVFSVNHNYNALYELPQFSTGDVQAQRIMSSMWGSMARTRSSPNVTGWTPMNANDYIRYNIEPPYSGPVKNYRDKFCDFYDSIGYTRRGW